MSTPITGRATSPNALVFTAVRRQGAGLDTLTFVSAFATSLTSLSVVVQTADLTDTLPAFTTSGTVSTLAQPLSATYWSEAVARQYQPILLLSTATSGSLLWTAAPPTAQTLTHTPGFGVSLRSVVTQCGLLQVVRESDISLYLLLTVANENAANTEPPFLLETSPLNPQATDIALYTGSGPFSPTPSLCTYQVTMPPGSFCVGRYECYCAQYNGVVTVLFGGDNTGVNENITLARYQAPLPSSSNFSFVGQIVVADGSFFLPHTIALTNGAYTLVLLESTSTSPQLWWSIVDPNLSTGSLPSPTPTIRPEQYGTGAIMAWEQSKLVWFCNAYTVTSPPSSVAAYSRFMVVNCESETITSSAQTNITADLLVYAGTTPAGVFCVAVSYFDVGSDSTLVTIYRLTQTAGPTYSWSADASPVLQIPSSAGLVIDLRADIDPASNTTLLVAVAINVWYAQLDLTA